MEIIDLPYFPYPRSVEGKRVPGYNFKWARQCETCDRQCETSASKGLAVCSYGVNYCRFSEKQIVFGFLLPGATATLAQKKALRQSPQNRITASELRHALEVLQAAQDGFNSEIAEAKKEIIEIYKQDQQFKKDLLDLLKPEIEKNLAFLHDYRQFVARVKQNINVVLQTRYGPGETDQLVSKASPAEGAIYWASLMMIEKLQTAFLLIHPERLQPSTLSVFRLHGMVLKYVRIYNASFSEKGVKVEVTGESVGEIRGDSAAVGIIPQTLLDNAFKYSERGSKVVVEFNESSTFINLAVTSFGPKIEADETSRIFDLFYRGRNAIKQQEEGAGFGLHLAQFVARSMGTEIRVSQSAFKSRFGFETTFSVRFARER